jgi:hypothetical protein
LRRPTTRSRPFMETISPPREKAANTTMPSIRTQPRSDRGSSSGS